MTVSRRFTFKPFLFSVLALLLTFGWGQAANAGTFKIDNFDDDHAAGWSTAVDSTTDSDGDNVPDDDEGDGDKDDDGIPDSEDFDPTGYLYDQADGRILAGGLVTISPGAGVIVTQNGSTGQYKFQFVLPGLYTLTVTAPPGYVAATDTCPNQDPPPLDAPDAPTASITLGNSEVGSTGFLSSNACTPYYYTIEFEAGDGDVLENNFPFRRIGAAVAPAASSYTLAAMVMTLMLLGAWRIGMRRSET